MLIRIGFEILIECPAATPLLLALSPHPSYSGRLVGPDGICTDPGVPLEEYVDGFGNRRTRLVAPAGRLLLSADLVVEDDGAPDRCDWSARQHEIENLPPDVLDYLNASRFCEVDRLVSRAWKLFGETPPGWPRVQAICDWVHGHLNFGYAFGRPTKTAMDALRERTGVCRDYAHLAIAFCRAMNIPARYASGYLGDIGVPPAGPGDFCAWFEVYLGDRWHTFDARYNVPRIGRVLMARGRDATDAAMITSFGSHEMKAFRVWTDEVRQSRPAPAYVLPAEAGRRH